MLQWLFQADKRVFHFSKRVEVRTSYSPRKNFSATYHNSRYSSQERREHRQNRLISPSQYFGKVLDIITYTFRLAWAQRTPCTAAETKSSRACGVGKTDRCLVSLIVWALTGHHEEVYRYRWWEFSYKWGIEESWMACRAISPKLTKNY